MADGYVGEIRLFAYDFAPEGWLPADGSKLSVSEYGELFTLIGHTYGKADNGASFYLPDLRGRVPFGTGDNEEDQICHVGGIQGGAEAVALTPKELPRHTHQLCVDPATNTANAQYGTGNPENTLIGKVNDDGRVPPNQPYLYGPPKTPLVSLAPGSIRSAVASPRGEAHSNMQPFLVLNFCICFEGIYPSFADA